MTTVAQRQPQSGPGPDDRIEPWRVGLALTGEHEAAMDQYCFRPDSPNVHLSNRPLRVPKPSLVPFFPQSCVYL